MKVIFLGAPGAGKGTQAEMLSKKLNIPTISTGNIIREAIKNSTELGLKAYRFTRIGRLVPDDVVIGIVNERLAEDDCQNGFILDGFPRTVPQAEALDKMGIIIDCVISLAIPDDVIVKRMSGRRSCPDCGATYHITGNPSKSGDRCEKCNAPLVERTDDAPEVVVSRLKIYHDLSEPLIEYYKDRLKVVDASNGTPEEIFDRLCKVVGIE